MNLISRVAPQSTFSHYMIQDLNESTLDCITNPNMFSFILFEQGRGSIMINDTKLSLITPMIVCLNEHDTLNILDSNKLKGKVIGFHPSLIHPNFNFENIRHFDHSFSAEDIKNVLHLSIFYNRYDNYIGQVRASEPAVKHIQKVLDTINSEMLFSEATSEALINIASYIERLVKTNTILSQSIIAESPLEIHDVLLYLHDHYKQKITIPLLSKVFHVNRTTLSDRFYEATGETIITYLNKQRINMATMLLRESLSPISDIAGQVGFNDTAYFAKLFKKYMRHTPTEYRQRYYSFSQSSK